MTPLSLRISVTDRCPLRCVYCMPAHGFAFASSKEILSFAEITSFVRVLKTDFGLSKVRLTGGELLLRPGLEELLQQLTALGIAELALTTNGQLLAEQAGTP